MRKTKKRNYLKKKLKREKKRKTLRLAEVKKNIMAGKYKKKNRLLELVQGKFGRFVRFQEPQLNKDNYIDDEKNELCLICKKPIGRRHKFQVKKFCSDECRAKRLEYHTEYLKNSQTVREGKSLAEESK